MGTISCCHCNRTVRYRDALEGKSIGCPKCRKAFRLPSGVSVRCDSCRRSTLFPQAEAGRRGACRRCGGEVQVPSADDQLAALHARIAEESARWFASRDPVFAHSNGEQRVRGLVEYLATTTASIGEARPDHRIAAAERKLEFLRERIARAPTRLSQLLGILGGIAIVGGVGVLFLILFGAMVLIRANLETLGFVGVVLFLGIVIGWRVLAEAVFN
jgi:hypothetical protein